MFTLFVNIVSNVIEENGFAIAIAEFFRFILVVLLILLGMYLHHRFREWIRRQ